MALSSSSTAPPLFFLCFYRTHSNPFPNLGLRQFSSHKPLPLPGRTLISNRLLTSLPKILCSQSPQNPKPDHKNPTFFTIVVRGVAVVLAGSLLSFATFCRRPALALDGAQSSNFSEPLEENIDAKEEKNEDEVEMYAKILEKNPSDVEALKAVLYGKMKQGKTKEAVRYVERLIELEPEEVEWQLLHALSYELMGKLDQAKKLFKEILKERPLLIRALHGLALAMFKNREGPAAFEMLNKALDLAHKENRVTEERNIKILIAQMYVVKGDLNRASKLFQDLVNENPRDFRPYLCQGIIYSLLDKKKEADEQFELYHSLVPDEFPQKGFIDDVILSAKTEFEGGSEQDLESEVPSRK